MKNEGLTWVDVTREFGDALRGMGYRLPKDWDDFIQEQEKLSIGYLKEKIDN